jgi:hypothetical protein
VLPHPCIARSRPVAVPVPGEQQDVLRNAVQNMNPQVIVRRAACGSKEEGGRGGGPAEEGQRAR